jgi:small-conductance mechanosensitive channel
MNLPSYLVGLPVLDAVASLALVLILLLARLAAGHAIRSRTDAPLHLQRRWTANIRNLLVFLGLVGLVMIWAPQLRTFALSLTAVAVAVVIATKELILCFSGSFMRASSRAFTVGDWIEVGGVRGEVIDHNLFVTTVHEFEPGSFSYTGRTAIVPNSTLLSQVIRNDSPTRDHAYHRFALTVDPSVDVYARRAAIEALVERRHAAFTDEAARANEAIERQFGVDLPDALVRVDFRTSDLGKYRIIVTLFCATRSADALENDVTCDIMSFLHETRRQDVQAAASEESPAG